MQVMPKGTLMNCWLCFFTMVNSIWSLLLWLDQDRDNRFYYCRHIESIKAETRKTISILRLASKNTRLIKKSECWLNVGVSGFLWIYSRRGSTISKNKNIFQKTNISYPLIRTRMCAYEGVRKVSFSKNFAYLLNGWSVFSNTKQKRFRRTAFCLNESMISRTRCESKILAIFRRNIYIIYVLK